MKKRTINHLAGWMATGMLLSVPATSFAGNEDRAGSAGATELLINPYAASAGWGDAATAAANGVDAMYLNIAGTAFTKGTEVMFTRTDWLVGSGTTINAVGLTQRVGESGVLGLSLMSMAFGDIEITTTELPEGGIGTFRPSYSNLSLSYAKEFSNSIYGGLAVKVISQRIADVGATGVAFDAGIRYVTGEFDQVKFGIALRNVGPPMSFSGDGFSISAVPQGEEDEVTLEQRSASYELPSQVNIGVSYRFDFNEMNQLTLAGNFISNSFTKDQFNGGAEYRFDASKASVMLRAGYTWEESVGDALTRSTALTGPAAGFSVELPAGETGTLIILDYGYRATNPFGGVHHIGARIALGGGAKEK